MISIWLLLDSSVSKWAKLSFLAKLFYFCKSLYSHCFLLLHSTHVEVVHRRNIITANQFLQQLNVDLVKVKKFQNIFFSNQFLFQKKSFSNICKPYLEKAFEYAYINICTYLQGFRWKTLPWTKMKLLIVQFCISIAFCPMDLSIASKMSIHFSLFGIKDKFPL